MTYVIGTGWWCGPRTEGKTYGDEIIRGPDFHHLWYETVIAFCSPEKIVIVDSASPIKPDIDKGDKRIEFISLAINPGHASSHRGPYSGWTASVLVSLEYALCSDADYYVYVEQDALLMGKGIIEHCIESMQRPFMFGGPFVFEDGTRVAQPLQQSFFLIRRDGMRKFLSRMHALGRSDSAIVPEWKFVFASSAFGWIANSPLYLGQGQRVLRRLFRAARSGYDQLPIGYGRSRPIDLTRPFVYFQHGSLDEIAAYGSRLSHETLARVGRKAPLLADHLSSHMLQAVPTT